ncbi:hypothetical protein Tco_1079131 [Tanacetum coccineum]|uniref:CCHC-type domain-containing protein n=1 Tax=Tanacetum coccineum TaxID=301880 RepID=A0ABQ5HR03_9ASTR
MSNTNNNLQTQTSNALHNAIMEAGGKDRLPMLAPGNYNPPYKFKWTEKTIPVAEGSFETTTKGYMENYKNVSQDIPNQLNAKAEAVHIILTGIDNDIYSTVDACPNACKMWKAIERLKQGGSINVQDLETNLYWEFGKFTSRDGESLESYYSRLYKMMNELFRNQCDVTNHQVNVHFLLQLQPEWQRFVTLVKQSQELKIVSYHKLYDILKQHQNEVNKIRAKILAHTNNPLALVSQQQPKIYKPTNNNLRTSSNTSRANQENSPRINKGTGYDNLRVVNVAGARENVGTQVVQKSGIQCYNCKEYRHASRECQKLKRAKDAAYHKEKMLLYKQEEAGVQLNAKQADWKDDTDDEPDDQALEAYYINHIYLAKQGDTKITIDSLDICYNRDQDDQDDTDDLDQERDLLASLIQKLKCEIDDNKNRNKFLESSNKALVDKWKDLKKFQAELDKYNDVNYASKVEINCAKAKGDLMSYKIDFEKSSNAYTRKINDLNQMILDMTKELLHPSRKPSSIMITKQKSLRISFT